MKFNLGKNSNKNSYEGFFINDVTILDVAIIEDPFKNNNPVDLAIEVTVDIGKEWTPKDIFWGNYKRDERGEIIGIGSAFRVTNMFRDILGIEEFDPEDKEQLNEILNNLKGKVVKRLTYKSVKNNKIWYKSYMMYHTDESVLANTFRKDLDKGRIKDFGEENSVEKEIFSKLGGRKIW